MTDALAITVSESTGTVTIFRKGKILVEIEPPRRVGPRRRQTDNLLQDAQSLGGPEGPTE